MKNDSFKMILAFLVTIVVVYGLPRLGIAQLVVQGIFLLLLFFVYRSKDDLFWFTWFFVVNDAPGRLFSGLSGSNLYGLPGYGIGTGLSLSFQDLFLLIYIIKLFRKRSSHQYMFKREMQLLIWLGIIYIAITPILGTTIQGIATAFRSVFYWLWAFIAARIIVEPEDGDRLFNLLLPVVIFTFLVIVYTYLSGNYLHNLLSSTSRFRSFEDSEEELLRAIFASSIMGISYVLSVALLFSKKTKISQNILIVGIFLSSLNILLSGTRGWILMLLLVLSSFFFLQGYGMIKQLFRVVVIVGLLFFIISGFFPVVFAQGNLAIERFLTLKTLTTGDITAEGTLSRLTSRGPRVMAAWRESPVIGWAFSKTFIQYSDIHVGNQTNLLNLGVLGVIPLYLAFVLILFKTWQRGNRNMRRSFQGNPYWVFIFALLGFFVIHSSSGIMWGLVLTGVSKHLLWAILFALINSQLSVNQTITAL